MFVLLHFSRSPVSMASVLVQDPMHIKRMRSNNVPSHGAACAASMRSCEVLLQQSHDKAPLVAQHLQTFESS